ncbi:MAG: hypothetical protein FWE74_06940 [Oscillospiraceae bacterium]|nr:hypothetical protein [Oscillospiraceae bacterium]
MKIKMRKLLLTLLTIIIAINAAGFVSLAADSSDAIPEIRRSTSATSDTRRVKTGESFDIIINVFDASYLTEIFTLNSLDYGDLILISSDVNAPSSIAVSRSYRFTFRVPDNAAKRQDIIYRISYSYMDEDMGTLSGSRTFSIPVEVTDSTADAGPMLENVRLDSAEVPKNTEFEVYADIFNGTDRITEAVLTVNSGTTQLARRFIGTVDAGKIVSDNLLHVSGITASGEHRLTVTLSYIGKSGENLTMSRNVTVKITEPVVPAHPVLENIKLSDNEIPMGAAFEVSADIFNGANDITNAVLTVNSGTAQLARRFIGVIEAGKIMPENTLTASGISFTGHQDLTITLSYIDRNGESLSVSRNIPIRVVHDAGLLNLQNISAPLRADVDAHATMSFALTNPTSVAIIGVEAFLYDDTGKELTSVYIRETGAHSSDTVTLSFPVTGRTGIRSYSLSIIYRDAANERKSISGSFSINVTAGEDDERPSGLRIQRIDTPAQTNTGVRTAIPFTLVNAGKGTAYNVEIYVLNEQGVELAREFVGSIPPSGSQTGAFNLRFDDPDNYNLTFHAVGESADESLSQASRAFELRVVNYRVTITDVGGHEWIWNNMSTIEFTVINGGSEEMLNVNVELADAEGNTFGHTYVGTILPGEKKERVRFRDIFIWDDGMGAMELFINLTYENKEMQEFPISHSITATFMSDGGYVEPPSWGDDYWEFEEEESVSVWLIILIAGISVLIVGGIVTIIIIRKKKKTRDEDDDIDYFLSQMKMDNSSPQDEKEEITNT